MLVKSMWTTKFTANISNAEIYLRVKLLPRNEYTTSLFLRPISLSCTEMFWLEIHTNHRARLYEYNADIWNVKPSDTVTYTAS
jgi:hypothetical protein